jgi:hypothetical protein
MTLQPDQSPNCGPADAPGPGPADLEPLPVDFEPDLQAIDALLREHAEGASVPAGLADRVFDASADGLPRPQAAPRRGPALTPARPWWMWRLAPRRQWRGGLAMAASLGLAFVIAAIHLSRPSRAAEAPSGLEAALAVDIEWHLEDLDREVDYLLETAMLMSEDDVTGEIGGLFPELDL